MSHLIPIAAALIVATSVDAEATPAEETAAVAPTPTPAPPAARSSPVVAAHAAPLDAPLHAPPAAASVGRPPDRDPPVDQICRAAVALALAEPERARAFVSRARMAGWLPEVRFAALRRLGRTEGLSYAAAGPEPVGVDAIDDVRYEWRATWDLSRIIFNPDELQAHFESLRMADARREIQILVIRLYFERRRLWSETAGGGGHAGTEADLRRQLRILEIEAQLDALSGGAFSRAAP